MHVVDTGLAAARLGADTGAFKADRALPGQLPETFVFQELRRQASWHESPTSFFHFRDKDGAEVDIVVELGSRAVAGVEVEAAATVTSKDFRGLRRLASASGDHLPGFRHLRRLGPPIPGDRMSTNRRWEPR